MRKLSPAEPVSQLRNIRIVENDEPMIDFLEAGLVLDRPRFNYRRETIIRRHVCEMLVVANEFLLRRGHHIKIVEGWRPPFIQRRMYRWSFTRFKERHPEYSHLQLTRLTNKFTAPMNSRVPPPHTTGGAVDVALYKGEEVADMMGPFGPTDHRGFVAWAKVSDEARRNRELLGEAFAETKITNYPSEYWHWSYGDQGWAYRGGHPNAIYGPVEPANWRPSVEDDTDEMLVFVNQEK
jgi:D-alanyl-D-alanine dipeptidase